MVSISKLIKSFKKCYNSFEVCSVFFENEGTWHNIITTLYLSKKDSVTPINDVLFDGEKIKILKTHTNMTTFSSYLTGLETGRINVQGFLIHFNPVDYDYRDTRHDEYHNFRETENAETFELSRGFDVFNDNSNLRDYLDQLNPDVIKLGFRDVFDFISHYTGIKKYSRSYNYDLHIIVPVYFSLGEMFIENNIFYANVTFDPKFKDLQINVIGISENNRNTRFRGHIIVGCQQTVQIPLTNMPPDSKLQVSLFSRSLPELQIQETVYVPITKPLLPFSQTYDQFFKLDELETIVTKPQTLDSNKRSDLYEKAVCDLFSLCGLSTVLLGENEILRLENKTQIGSADILAYDGQEHLLVIDCDIMVPDIKKANNLVHLCKYLGDLPGIRDIKYIIPVIVSPNYSNNIDSEVLQLSESLIMKIFEGIHFKNTNDLVSMITEPYHENLLFLSKFGLDI